jgi:hypothetical protein
LSIWTARHHRLCPATGLSLLSNGGRCRLAGRGDDTRTFGLPLGLLILRSKPGEASGQAPYSTEHPTVGDDFQSLVAAILREILLRTHETSYRVPVALRGAIVSTPHWRSSIPYEGIVLQTDGSTHPTAVALKVWMSRSPPSKPTGQARPAFARNPKILASHRRAAILRSEAARIISQSRSSTEASYWSL